MKIARGNLAGRLNLLLQTGAAFEYPVTTTGKASLLVEGKPLMGEVSYAFAPHLMQVPRKPAPAIKAYANYKKLKRCAACLMICRSPYGFAKLQEGLHG